MKKGNDLLTFILSRWTTLQKLETDLFVGNMCEKNETNQVCLFYFNFFYLFKGKGFLAENNNNFSSVSSLGELEFIFPQQTSQCYALHW